MAGNLQDLTMDQIIIITSIISLCCWLLCSNVLTPIVLAKLVFLHYLKMGSKISSGDFMKYFYWAAVGTAFLINIGYTITSLMHQYHNRPSISSCIIQLSNHKCSIPFDTSVYNDEVLTLAAKFAITPMQLQ